MASCDCKHPVAAGSHLDTLTNGIARDFVRYCSANGCSQSEAMATLNRLGRTSSTTVSTRVPNETARAVRALADAHGLQVGAYVREVLALAVGPGDPASILTKIAKALGLPAETSPSDVVRAVGELVEEIERGAPNANANPNDATPENAEPPGAATLNAATRAQITKLGMTEAEFRARREKAVRRTGARPAAASPSREVTVATLSLSQRESARRAGIDLDEYARRLNAAIRRA